MNSQILSNNILPKIYITKYLDTVQNKDICPVEKKIHSTMICNSIKKIWLSQIST